MVADQGGCERWGRAQRNTHTVRRKHTRINYRRERNGVFKLLQRNFVQEGSKQVKPTFLRSFYEREKGMREADEIWSWARVGWKRDVRMRRGSSARVDLGVIVDRVGVESNSSSSISLCARKTRKQHPIIHTHTLFYLIKEKYQKKGRAARVLSGKPRTAKRWFLYIDTQTLFFEREKLRLKEVQNNNLERIMVRFWTVARAGNF